MAVGLRASKIGRGQRSVGSCHNEVDYSSRKCNLGLYVLLNFECVPNGLPWRRLRFPNAYMGCDNYRKLPKTYRKLNYRKLTLTLSQTLTLSPKPRP